MNKKVVLLIIIISLPFLLNGRIILEPEKDQLTPNMKLSALIPHPELDIINDTDFAIQVALEFWPGNGSEADPYMISNFLFDSATIDSQGIALLDTRSYFIIENCEFKDSVSQEIYLGNVTNGKIVNSTFSNTYASDSISIHIHESNNILIENNTISNGVGVASDGIYLRDSYDITLKNNILFNIADRAIEVYIYTINIVFNIQIINNYINSSIVGIDTHSQEVYVASNNTINNNVIEFCVRGMSLHNLVNTEISENIVRSNSEHGIYFDNNIGGNIDLRNNYLSNNALSGIAFWSYIGPNSEIINNTIHTNGNYGIYLNGVSSGLIIINNTILYNSLDGIYLRLNQGFIVNNTIIGNGGQGLRIQSGYYNTIKYNWVENNFEYGLYLFDNGLQYY